MYHIETNFMGKWSWLDSFDTLEWALGSALHRKCNWRIVNNGFVMARSI